MTTQHTLQTRLLALDTLAGIPHAVLFPPDLQPPGIPPVLGG